MAPLAHACCEYVRHGFALVPIMPGQKLPSISEWNTRAKCIKTADSAAKLTHHNVGIAHLFSGTCALDVDDVKLATPWLGARGVNLHSLVSASDAVIISSGRENRTKLLYRLPLGVAAMPHKQPQGSGLELRCATADLQKTVQDVLPPSVHPATGKPYVWAGAGNWRKLPVLPTCVYDLWRALDADRLTADQIEARRKAREKRNAEMDVAEIEEELRLALQVIPSGDYTTWLSVGQALHNEFDGDEAGLEVWDSWSESNDDTGAYQAGACAAKWNTFNGNGLTVGSVYWLAQKHRQQWLLQEFKRGLQHE